MSKPKVNLTVRIDEEIYKKFDKAGFNFSKFIQNSLYALIKEKKVFLNLVTGEVFYSLEEVKHG